MRILPLPNFISVIKNKHLLLDTNVFIDTLLNPLPFADFFNSIKSKEVTLTTIDLVKIEFLKGASDFRKYKEKNELIEKIVDYIIPITPDIYKNAYELIKKYEMNGKALSETDLFLGATLMKFKKNIYLLTKNTTDFPLNIFELHSVVNTIYSKGIHSYGLYQTQ